MVSFLTRQPTPIAFVEALALLIGISWLDLATGHQISLVLFYSAPIVLAVWLCDNKSAFGVAGLAGVLWSWADIVVGHSYPSATVQGWEIAIRFAFFFLVALAGIAVKERHRASSARISLLEHARKLEQQIIEVSEYEQQRIGRDLHDGLCQYLAAVGCAATSLKIDLERRGLDGLAVTAAEIEKLLEESVKQARTLAHGLVPVQLDEAGLPAALQELVTSTSRLFGMECSFEFAGENASHHPGKATHLYRIAQEAINNATKHGKARHVDVRLSANRSAMSLSIADDGTGFSKTEKATNGVGLSIMRYRANVLGGEFEIEGRPKGGTIVSCTVPTGESGLAEPPPPMRHLRAEPAVEVDGAYLCVRHENQ
jgi:signal transduction histidine kinase